MNKKLEETLLELLPEKEAKETVDPGAGSGSIDSFSLVGLISQSFDNNSKIVIGKISTFLQTGEPVVQFGTKSAEARTILSLTSADVGREVVISFEGGDPDKPIIMGLLQVPLPDGQTLSPESKTVDVQVDGESVTLTGKKEIVLRCGKASITLTRAGKVLIRGAYVLSRSSGANRIKGGSVQIN